MMSKRRAMNRYQLLLALITLLTARGENGGSITPGKTFLRRQRGWRRFFPPSRLLPTPPGTARSVRNRRKQDAGRTVHDGRESNPSVGDSVRLEGSAGGDSKQGTGGNEKSHSELNEDSRNSEVDQDARQEFPRIETKRRTMNQQISMSSSSLHNNETPRRGSSDQNHRPLPQLFGFLMSPVFQRLSMSALAAFMIREIVTTFVEEWSEVWESPASRKTFNPKQVSLVLNELVTKQQLHPDHLALATLAFKLHVASGLPYFATGRDQAEQPRKSVQSILLSLTKAEVNLLDLALYDPKASSSESWQSIEGLDNVKEDLLDRVLSLQLQSSSSPFSSLTKSDRGILLYGPPGCGKSMLIRGLASLAKAPTLVVSPSVLIRKYVGETNQLVRTLFTLARKLSPCILWLDEVDGMFRERHDGDLDAMREWKAELLQQWDGIQTSTNNSGENYPILVLASSNRPFDVDPAVLRRLSQSYFVGLPMEEARFQIVESLLKKVPRVSMDLKELVMSTEGFAPSDLVQLVETAAQIGPIRDGRKNEYPHGPYRPLRLEDLVEARRRVGPTPLSRDYCDKLAGFTSMASPTFQQRRGPHSNGAASDPSGMSGPYYAVDSVEIEAFLADKAGDASDLDFDSTSESEWTDDSEGYSEDEL